MDEEDALRLLVRAEVSTMLEVFRRQLRQEVQQQFLADAKRIKESVVELRAEVADLSDKRFEQDWTYQHNFEHLVDRCCGLEMRMETAEEYLKSIGAVRAEEKTIAHTVTEQARLHPLREMGKKLAALSFEEVATPRHKSRDFVHYAAPLGGLLSAAAADAADARDAAVTFPTERTEPPRRRKSPSAVGAAVMAVAARSSASPVASGGRGTDVAGKVAPLSLSSRGAMAALPVVEASPKFGAAIDWSAENTTEDYTSTGNFGSVSSIESHC